LRKSTGISIDDKIEVFYKLTDSSKMLNKVIDAHAAKIRKAIRMPFLSAAEFMQPNVVIIGKTEYEAPEDSSDKIELFVCKPCVQVDESKLKKDFGDSIAVSTVRTYLSSISKDVLAKMVKDNGGVITVNLDKTELKLKHKEHFYLDAGDKSGK